MLPPLLDICNAQGASDMVDVSIEQTLASAEDSPCAPGGEVCGVLSSSHSVASFNVLWWWFPLRIKV